MKRSLQVFLTQRPPFADLAPELLARVLDAARLLEVPRGGALWRVGEPVSECVVIRRGVLREARPAPDGACGRPVTLGLHGKGAVLGVERLLGPREASTASCTLEAWEQSTVLRIPRAALVRAAESSAPFALALGTAVARRSLWLEDRLGAWMHRSASARLAALLLELADTFGVRDSRGVILPLRLPHREIASLIGVTRETTTLALLALRRAGWVEVDGKRLVLLDEAALLAHWRDDEPTPAASVA